MKPNLLGGSAPCASNEATYQADNAALTHEWNLMQEMLSSADQPDLEELLEPPAEADFSGPLDQEDDHE